MYWYTLINSKTKQRLKQGDDVVTFRGERGILMWLAPPVHAESSGRVGVRLLEKENQDFVYSWFPGVIGAEFKEEIK